MHLQLKYVFSPHIKYIFSDSGGSMGKYKTSKIFTNQQSSIRIPRQIWHNLAKIGRYIRVKKNKAIVKYMENKKKRWEKIIFLKKISKKSGKVWHNRPEIESGKIACKLVTCIRFVWQNLSKIGPKKYQNLSLSCS